MPLYRCTACAAVEDLHYHPECCSLCRGRLVALDAAGQCSAEITFDFLTLPDQAWLLVPATALATVRISTDTLDPATRRSNAGVFALPEETSATRFMNLWQDRFGIINIAENRLSPKIIETWTTLAEGVA